MAQKVLTLRGMIGEHQRSAHLTPYSNCFGDGFLFQKNPVYRRVRKAFDGMGGEFTFEDHCYAKAFPWLALPSMVNTGKIVLFENVAAIEHFGKLHPQISFDLFRQGAAAYIKSDLFHDPFHFVTYRLLFGSRKLNSRIAKTPETILAVLMSESLTHSAEALLSTYSDSKEHFEFLNFNIHQQFSEKELEWRRAALKEFGAENFFRLYFFASLFGQFLYLYSGPEQVRGLFKLARLPSEMTRRFDLVTHFFEDQMSHNFIKYKVKDAELFFRMLGFNSPILELLDFDFMSLFWKGHFGAVLDKTISIVNQKKMAPKEFTIYSSKESDIW